MATDSTHLLPGDTGIETDTDMSSGSPDLGSVQLAAASADAPVPVNIPHGQQVVVIPVKPGQIIELPTDSPDGLLAKLGADGNLAIVVDGRTIILQGYADANAESPIKIVTNDGDAVDITDVIVATNPDVALDIQTAAGPAAAGAQAGTAGADAAGSGIFVPFAAGPLLGGIDAVGVLGATQLAYKNITDERKLFTIQEEANHLPEDIKIVPDEGQPTGEGAAFLLDEDFLKLGNHDLPSSSPQDDDGSAVASGTVVVNFGLDGPRAVDPIVMDPIADGTPSGLFTTDGTPILLHLDAPAGGSQVLHGYLTAPGVDDVIVLTLNTTTGHFEVVLNEALHHDENSFEDNVSLSVGFSAFDSNGDVLSATLDLSFDDDMPTIGGTESTISLVSDETVSFFKSDFDDPNFPNDGVQDGSRIEGDENVVPLPAELTAIGKAIGAATADASVLFDVDFGADGGAAKDSAVFSLTILDANTGLFDTTTGDPILLVDNGGVIEGRADDGDPSTTDPVVFALTIDNNGEIALAQYRAVDHGHTEAAPGAHDEVIALGADKLGVTLTAVDGDGDQASKTVDIGGSIKFEDDGPRWSSLSENNFILDEDALPNGVAGGPGNSGSGTLSTGTIVFNFGSDLPGTLAIAELTVRNSLGAVVALEDLHTADGHDITINKSVDAGTGVITWQGVVADGPNAGDPVFTFTLDGSGANQGDYTFTLHAALEHPFTDADSQNNGPESAWEDTLGFSFEVLATDGDGDTATRTIDLYVNDDTPIINSKDAAIALAVDETVGGDGKDVDDPFFIYPQDGTTIENDEDLVDLPDALDSIGKVIGAATADASTLFSVQFGADGGAATDAEDFSLIIMNPDTGLKDTASGLPIVLFDNNGVIEARAVDGNPATPDPVVFALTVDAGGVISMAQYRAIDHGADDGEGGSAFDEVLFLGAQKLGLLLTVTDADGDQTTAFRDLGTVISFDDDGPRALNDKDSVTEDGPTIATGNVITGVDGGLGTEDANSDDGVADTIGSDGFKSITWSGDSGGFIDSPYGKLFVDGSGNYKYELDNGSQAVQDLKEGETKTETFFYTIVDGDGDKSTASLTITISGKNDGPTIDFFPKDPEVKNGRTVVSDEGLKDANPDSNPVPNDETNLASNGTTFTVSDPDVGDTLTVVILNTGLPALSFGGVTVDWSVDPDGHTLRGQTGGTDAITVHISTLDGFNYQTTVTLLKPLDHPLTNDPSTLGTETSFEDELFFPVTLKVTDSQGAFDTAQLVVEVEDDSPRVIRIDGQFLLHVDETVDGKGGGDVDANGSGLQDGGSSEGDEVTFAAAVAAAGLDKLGTVIGASTSNASGILGGTAGADGEASHAYTLDILNGGLTTLKDTQTGGFIQLISKDGFVEGVVQGTDTVVFAFDIDESTGLVTMAQYRAVDHGTDQPNSYPDEVTFLGSNVLQVTYSITDKDGDTGSNSADIGNSITFDDDGPNADLISFSIGGDGKLVHDETAGVQDNGNSPNDPGASGQDEDDVASRPSEFAAFETLHPSLVSLGYATTSISLNTSGAYGSDGPGTTTITLTNGGNPFNGQQSTLFDTATGNPIFLFTENGLLVGREGTSSINAANGPIVFAISIDSDSLDVAQYRAIKHPNTGSDDDSVTLGVFFTITTVSATITVTDKDGDSVTKNVDLNSIIFQDDGPTANDDKDSVQEDGPTTATGNVVTAADGGLGSDANGTDGVADTLGQDGFKSITWVGEAGGSIDSPYGKLFVDASGNYKYELDNSNAIVQGLKEGETKTEIFTYSIEDGDGDKETATLTITITGKNDTPTIDLNPTDPETDDRTAVISDEGLPNANPDGTGQPTDDTNLKTFVGTLKVSDPDVGDTLTVAMLNTGTFPSWTFSGGFPVSWSLSLDGLTLTGTANGNPALTVVIAPSGVNTYTYTVTLLQPLDHPLHDDPSTGGAEISFEDELSFNITVQVKDSQGATDNAILSVQVEDDSPTAMTPEVTAVVEDEQFNPSTDEPAGVAGDPNPDLGASVSGDVSNNGSWGADGFGRITQVQIGANTAVLVPNGGSVTVYWSQAGVYQGTNAVGAAVSLLINGTGTYTFTLLDNMLIASGAGELIDSLGTATFTGVDKDGDGATISLGLSVKDDIPAFISPDTLHLENKGVIGTGDQVIASLNFASGADGASNAVFNVAGVPVGVTSGVTVIATDGDGHQLTVGGQLLYLYYGGAGGTDTSILVAKTLTGTVGFTIDIDHTTNTYIYNQEAAISNGTEVSATNLTGVGAGNPAFKLLIDIGGTTQDVAMTTKVGDSINSDVNDIGISQGQTFQGGEAIRFDLVNGLKVDGGTPEGYSYDGTHNTTTRWKQTVFLTGNASIRADFIVTAIVADSDNIFFADVGETTIDLHAANIHIYDNLNNLIDPSAYAGLGISLVEIGNSIQINGIPDHWAYEIVTGAGQEFSAIKVEGAAGTDNFSLSFFSYGTDSAGTSIDLSYDVVGTDGDGDKTTGDIDVSLYPDATSSSGASFAGTAGNDTFLGNQGANSINGADGNDLLAGNGGIDTINGGAGNDTIVGGASADILDGGSGNDVFVYETLVDGGDKIANFNTAAGGDQLDVKEVLDHDGNTWDDTASGTVAAAIAGGYITFTDGGGGNVQVNVDIDGAGTAYSAVAVAVLTGVTVASAQGGDLNDNIVVN